MAGATMRARMSLPAPAADGTTHSIVEPAFGKAAAAVVVLLLAVPAAGEGQGGGCGNGRWWSKL